MIEIGVDLWFYVGYDEGLVLYFLIGGKIIGWGLMIVVEVGICVVGEV